MCQSDDLYLAPIKKTAKSGVCVYCRHHAAKKPGAALDELYHRLLMSDAISEVQFEKTPRLEMCMCAHAANSQ